MARHPTIRNKLIELSITVSRNRQGQSLSRARKGRKNEDSNNSTG